MYDNHTEIAIFTLICIFTGENNFSTTQDYYIIQINSYGRLRQKKKNVYDHWLKLFFIKGYPWWRPFNKILSHFIITKITKILSTFYYWNHIQVCIYKNYSRPNHVQTIQKKFRNVHIGMTQDCWKVVYFQAKRIIW